MRRLIELVISEMQLMWQDKKMNVNARNISKSNFLVKTRSIKAVNHYLTR